MDRGETISVPVTPETARALRESVEAGEYPSASAALGDAVRLWQRRRREDAEQLDAIRARIRRSLDDPRPSLSIDEVRAQMETLFAEARDGAHRG